MTLHLAGPVRVLAALCALSLAGFTALWSVNTYRASAYTSQARALLPLGQYDAASSLLGRARSLTPRDAAVTTELGKVHYLMSAFRHDRAHARQALVYYQEAVELNPLDGLHYSNLGWAYLLSYVRSYKAARAAFRKALERDPYNTYYLYSLGRLFEKMGSTEEARATYRRALTIKDDRLVRARLDLIEP